MREIDTGEDRRKIGGYEVVSTVARGGMGVIYKGYDSILNRHIAIKVLAQEFVNDLDALKRFEREAKAITKIRHKNVAIVHGIGKTDEGLPYIIMELVDGPSFMELITSKVNFQYSRWAELFIQACEGLRAAYQQNVIHRDIKPSNVMLNRDDLVKIVDFGLAKIIREDTYKTVEGMVLGTPRYMAPEQALGRTIDHRSDIYSLGATFYHILAQQPPFEAETLIALMMKHTSAPLTPIYLINPKVPQDLCEVVHKMLAKDVNERFQDYDEIIDALKSVKLARLSKEKGTQNVSGRGDVKDDQYVFKFGGRTPGSQGLVTGPKANEYRIADSSPTVDASSENLVLSQSKIPEPSFTSSQDNLQNKQDVYEPGFGGYSQPDPTARVKEKFDTLPKIEIKESSSRFIVIAFAIILIFLAALTYVFSQLNPKIEDDEEIKQKGAIAKVIEKIFPPKDNTASTKEESSQVAAIEKTKRNLQIVYSAIFEYEAKKGEFPDRLKMLVSENLCTFEDLKDGWNNNLVYIVSNKKLLSFGQDHEESTSDDFWVDQNGLHLPKAEVLKEIETKGNF